MRRLSKSRFNGGSALECGSQFRRRRREHLRMWARMIIGMQNSQSRNLADTCMHRLFIKGGQAS